MTRSSSARNLYCWARSRSFGMFSPSTQRPYGNHIATGCLCYLSIAGARRGKVWIQRRSPSSVRRDIRIGGEVL
jgi:hypothetical protein